MTQLLNTLRGWLTLADYYEAKEKANTDVIARYSRGNVLVQNGSVMDSHALDKLSAQADKAAAELQKFARL